MSPDTRKGCQKCRFEKCLKVGMKPGWVLNDDERATRFRKLRMKKAKQLEVNHSPNSSRSDPANNDSDDQTGNIYSPMQYPQRRRQSFPVPSHDNFERENENASHYGYNRMYLRLQEERECMGNTLHRGGEYTSPDTIQPNKMREDSYQWHTQMLRPIKLENDHILIADGNPNSFHSSEDITSFPEENAYSSFSAQHNQNEEREESDAFLGNKRFKNGGKYKPTIDLHQKQRSFSLNSNNKMEGILVNPTPAELIEMSKDPAAILFQSQPKLALYSSAETPRFQDRADTCSFSTSSTFKPFTQTSSATTNRGYLQSSAAHEPSIGQMTPKSSLYSGFNINRSKHSSKASFRQTELSTSSENGPETPDNRPISPTPGTSYNYDNEHLMNISKQLSSSSTSSHNSVMSLKNTVCGFYYTKQMS